MKKLLVLVSVMATMSQVHAQTFVLNSLNTSATLAFGTDGGAVGPNQRGPVFNWSVGGPRDGLFEQGYYVKIGNGPVDNINRFFVSATQVSPDRVDSFFLDNVSGLAFNIRFLLTGSPSGQTADLAEVVTVHNAGNNSVGFELFQFNDFDLAGNAGGDTATLLNSSTFQQTDGAHSVTVGVTGIPTLATTGLAFGTGNIRTAMQAGTLTSQNTFTGDAAFIFGYRQQLAVGQSWQMSANKIYTVPEPATMTALGLGALALLRRRRAPKA